MATPEEATATMIANLREKTGKTLEQWTALVAKQNLAKHGQIVAFLKTGHAMTHGYANLVAHKALASDAESVAATTDLVAAQYAGNKAALRPIYDALLAMVGKLGKDVELAPKKAYVSLRRSKQFGLIQPSTATRVDLGLNLKNVKPEGRLEASGSWNSMCSHRIRLGALGDVDRQVADWLKQAYEGA